MFQPLFDRILVRPLEADERTKGGLYLPDQAKERPQKGVVIAHGAGRITERGVLVPISILVGDTILYGKYAGSEVEIDGETFLLLKESDVYGLFPSDLPKEAYDA